MKRTLSDSTPDTTDMIFVYIYVFKYNCSKRENIFSKLSKFLQAYILIRINNHIR